MKIKIYADTSDIKEIMSIYENDKSITGFTTNPTLMRKAGVTDYIGFVKEVTSKIKDLPFSFEIFADELDEMEYQIQKISEYGDNIYVKIPVTNTKGVELFDLIGKMSQKGIKINVTAMFTFDHVNKLNVAVQKSNTPIIASIFSGRIADTGSDPSGLIIVSKLIPWNNCDMLWASVRQVYNIYEAEKVGCDIITVPPDILKKYKQFKNKNLNEFSLETVKMFYEDAKAAGYML